MAVAGVRGGCMEGVSHGDIERAFQEDDLPGDVEQLHAASFHNPDCWLSKNNRQSLLCSMSTTEISDEVSAPAVWSSPLPMHATLLDFL